MNHLPSMHTPLGQTPPVRQHNFLHLVIIASVALLPFQTLAVEVGTTKFDWSNFALVIIAISSLPIMLKKKYDANFIFFISLYFGIQLFMFTFGPVSWPRFASAFLWLTAVFLLYGSRTQIHINSKLLANIVYIGILITSLSIIYAYFVNSIERPGGSMDEPSVAGLLLLAGATGCLISAHWEKIRWRRILLYSMLVFLVTISIMVKTTHIFTFIFSVVILGILSRAVNLSQILLILLSIFVLYLIVVSDEHYLSRIDLQNPAGNLSLLAWLHGFDQMVASLTAYPLVGVGAGGTGQFDFYSVNGEYLSISNLSGLSRLDAYSGMFRLIIELGPVLTLFILLAIAGRLKHFGKSAGDGSLPFGVEAQSQVFLFAFAVCLLFGIMLKEPTYSRSQFAVASLLFALVPLRVPAAGPSRKSGR